MRKRRTKAPANAKVVSESIQAEEAPTQEKVISRYTDLMQQRKAAQKRPRFQYTKEGFVTPDGVDKVESSRRLFSKLDLESDSVKTSASESTPGMFDRDPRSVEEADIIAAISQNPMISEDLGHCLLPPKATVDETVRTDVFPYYPGTNRDEYFLMAVVIDCADYHTTAAYLEAGVIQFAVTLFKSNPTIEMRVLLLVLLRLAASCCSHAHFLLSVQKEIFPFLHDCIRTARSSLATFDLLPKRRQFSDSRAYSSFLAIAFAAHTRQTDASYEYMSKEQKAFYENHVKLIVTAYGSIFQDPKNYIYKLPAHLARYQKTFHLSDMGAAIFIDLAPRGFFASFISSMAEIKWDRCFNHYLAHAPLTIDTLKLYRLLHQSPLIVAAYLAFPFSIYLRCFGYLSWGLETTLDNEFFRNPHNAASYNRPRTHVPLDFCIVCAETLRAFLDFPSVSASPSMHEVKAFLRQPVVIHELLRFVLAMPNVVDASHDARLHLLYSSVWSLIHATSYTFSVMHNTLVEFACDRSTPFCLGVQAAMYLAAAASFGGVKIRRSEAVSIFLRLLKQLQLSRNEPRVIIRRRQELTLRMAAILCPNYFGAGTSLEKELNAQAELIGLNNGFGTYFDTSASGPMQRIFTEYEFRPEKINNPAL